MQRIIVGGAMGLILLSVVVPPWRIYILGRGQTIESTQVWYQPIWSPPWEQMAPGYTLSGVLYVQLLLLEWLGIVLLVTGGLLLRRSTTTKRGTNLFQHNTPAGKIERPQTLEYKAAVFCSVGAEKSIEQIADLEKLSVQVYLNAIIEVVCCAVHLADRTCALSDPHLRSSRIQRLLDECNEILPQPFYQSGMSDYEKQEINNNVQEIFLSTFEKRTKQYALLVDDWERRVIWRGARHLVEALGDSEQSIEKIMEANIQLVALHTAMLEAVPEFFQRNE